MAQYRFFGSRHSHRHTPGTRDAVFVKSSHTKVISSVRLQVLLAAAGSVCQRQTWATHFVHQSSLQLEGDGRVARRTFQRVSRTHDRHGSTAMNREQGASLSSERHFRVCRKQCWTTRRGEDEDDPCDLPGRRILFVRGWWRIVGNQKFFDRILNAQSRRTGPVEQKPDEPRGAVRREVGVPHQTQNTLTHSPRTPEIYNERLLVSARLLSGWYSNESVR